MPAFCELIEKLSAERNLTDEELKALLEREGTTPCLRPPTAAAGRSTATRCTSAA